MTEPTDPNRSPFYGMPLCPHRIQFDCQQCRLTNGPVLEGNDIFDWATMVDELTALLTRATDVLERADDWGHPFSHNAYVDEVAILLADIGDVLNDENPADADIAAGRVRRFDNVEDFLADLDSDDEN